MENSKSNFPEISIIVPVYNVEKYLPKCIDSLLAQTLTDIEIILVDDGSPDYCPMICDSYAEKDSRIKVIHKQNEGVSAARNDGIAAARADIIGFVDSDDWVDPKMYETMLSALKRTGADIVVCNTSYDYIDHSHPDAVPITEEKIYSRNEALRLLIQDRMIHNYPCDKIFRKSVLNSPFTPGIRYEDIEVMIRWFANINRLATIPYVGYHYLQRASSYLHSSSTMFEEYIAALRSQLDFLKSKNLIPDCYESYTLRIVKDGVKYSKYLVHDTTDSPKLYSTLKEIADTIRDLQPAVDSSDVSKKLRKRFDNLLNHPRRFVSEMRWNHRYHILKNRLTTFRHKKEHKCFD